MTKLDLSRPLGPLFGKLELDKPLLELLNSRLSDGLKDYSQSLVGKVDQELHFDEETLRTVLTSLREAFIEYHLCYFPEHRRYKSLDIGCTGAWYVRQFENEYNPLHVHNNATISCVGYLKLPEGIESEFEADALDHHPSNGQIEFAYGTASTTYTTGTMRVKPRVGDFYIFPSGLWHTVYPFKTPGERRSFSMNINIRPPSK